MYQRGRSQSAPRFRLIGCQTFMQQLFRYANIPLSEEDWEMSVSVCSLCAVNWCESQLRTVFFSLLPSYRTHEHKPYWSPEPGFQWMCPPGQQTQKPGHHMCTELLFHRTNDLGQPRGRVQGWNLLASLVPNEDCTWPLDLCLIRALPLRPQQ